MVPNSGVRIAMLAVLMGFIAGVAFNTLLHLTGCSADAQIVNAERGPDPKTIAGFDATSPFKAAAKFAMPSCVSISTKARVRQAVGFGFDVMGNEAHLGSGVILDADGNIVTNYHVIQGATEISVELATGESLPATIVGSDPESDLAVIKVTAANLVPAEFGDSDAIDIGDRVIAIGSPFGLSQSVTDGIISSRERKNMNLGSGRNDRFIQTSAAINPGNSGGALCDLSGRVIGINTAIKSLSGGFEGIGFAIPGNHARRVATEIVRIRGNWRPSFLGIGWRPAYDHELAQLPVPEGATALWITGVVEGSPAAAAGLQVNDIIVSFQGKPIDNPADVVNGIQYAAPGSTVDLEILRHGERKKVVATLRQKPQ